MTENRVENKPSETALMAALRRALANQEYGKDRFGPDDLAIFFLPPYWRFFLKFEKVRVNTGDKLDRFFPGMNPYIIARTAYFDGLFVAALQDRIPQVVILGAGYDSRAYRFAKLLQDTKVFELDIAPTQEWKKSCLKKAKIGIPAQVAFVPIDFNKESLKDVLEKAGYQDHQRTLFIWEGVTYYLDPGSVEATLEFFSHSSHPDSLLAFDYGSSITEENMDGYYGAKEFTQSMKEQHADEAVRFSIDEGRMGSFLEQRGLKMVEHLDDTEIEKKFLTKDDGSLIGQVIGHLRFVLVSPQK